MIDKEFLTENNISISKVTYSYKFPYEIIYKYQKRKEYSCNEERNKFLQSIYDRLLKLDDSDLILDRPNYIIELKYFYKNKYYNININSERITFNNIDYENIGELDIIVLDLIGFNFLEMGKHEIHNIVYKIDFESYYINNNIKIYYDFILDDIVRIFKPSSIYNGLPPKKRLIKFYDKRYKTKLKINLKGRNKWLIQQNMKHCSNDDFVTFYEYIKSTVILPSLLKNLQKDKYSLFNYLLPEIIDVVIKLLYIIGNKENIKNLKHMII